MSLVFLSPQSSTRAVALGDGSSLTRMVAAGAAVPSTGMAGGVLRVRYWLRALGA